MTSLADLYSIRAAILKAWGIGLVAGDVVDFVVSETGASEDIVNRVLVEMYSAMED